MYYLYHETTFKNFLKILKCKKLSISSHVSSEKNQGGDSRRLALDPLVSLREATFGDDYDEVDAAYFRLLGDDFFENFNSDVALIFSRDVLKEKSFIANTEENFGFAIAEEGKVGTSQFSGEEGMSVWTRQKLPLLLTYDFRPACSEVAVLEDVELSYLFRVVIRKTFDSEIPELQVPIKLL